MRKGIRTMKAIPVRLILVLFLVVIATPAHAVASDKSSGCVQMAEMAGSFLQDKGKGYALKVFSASKGPFIDRELYVFACSMDGILLAHPYRRDLVGKDVNDLRDSKGKAIFQEFRRVAVERGAGWIDYWWPKPGEQGQFPKMTYIKRIPDQDLYVGVGYYEEQQPVGAQTLLRSQEKK
jgi:cytochrome c